MKRRVEIDCDVQPKKCAKRCSGNNDLISQLPNDILVDILSLLSLKEAARTSVLSSRWVNLWKHTPTLDFDDQTAFEKIHKQIELLESEALKYVNWVDSVVKSHRSPTLKEFAIRFSLDTTSKNSISRWLEFAFSRQVQRLELDLGKYSSWPKYYCFPNELKELSFKSLKELSFKSVHLSDGVIESFLNNCPLLERLVVRLTNKISNVQVCGPSLRLKHLEIVYCTGLKSLKVSVPNLTSLRVSRPEGLVLDCVPMLVDVSINCGDCDESVKSLLSTLSCCISQLEILSLVMYKRRYVYEEPVGLCKFTEMPKLKKLVINYSARGHENLVWLTALMRASPCLEEFGLNYGWYKLARKNREVKDPMRCPHHNLKVFKFSGYYGRSSDAELLGYILENCVVLEKIIIDSSSARSPKTDKYDVERTARKNAKRQLEPKVPHHVELVFL
ncbi:hypothetical protein ACP275_10G074300 [Erythranthe tilingii]